MSVDEDHGPQGAAGRAERGRGRGSFGSSLNSSHGLLFFCLVGLGLVVLLFVVDVSVFDLSDLYLCNFRSVFDGAARGSSAFSHSHMHRPEQRDQGLCSTLAELLILTVVCALLFSLSFDRWR